MALPAGQFRWLLYGLLAVHRCQIVSHWDCIPSNPLVQLYGF